MEVSERIRAVAEETAGSLLADVGTDHGYIPILAVSERRVSRAIACDINSGPLSRATENIQRYGLNEKIETRLGGGLGTIQPGEADCIAVAGMGGKLMIDILRDGADVAAGARLVLQPQLDVPDVRRYVHSAGFSIVNERMVLEDKFYTIITCEPGRDSEYSEADYLLGRLLIVKKDRVLRKFVLKQLETYERIIKAVPEASGRAQEIAHEMKIFEEVLNCL